MSTGDDSDMKVAVAVLQEQMATVQKAQEELKEDMDEKWISLESNMRTLIIQQHDTNKELARYRGFWGGITLIVGAVWAFITVMGPSIWASIKAKL